MLPHLIDSTGDELGLVQIQQTTDQSSQRLAITEHLPDGYATLGLPSQHAARNQFETTIRQRRTILLDALHQAATTANASGTGQESDLWGTLQTINIFFRDARPADRCVVYYLSDMVESKTGAGRVDYYHTPLTTPPPKRRPAPTFPASRPSSASSIPPSSAASTRSTSSFRKAAPPPPKTTRRPSIGRRCLVSWVFRLGRALNTGFLSL